MELDKPFIRLPYVFDPERLAREVAGLPASAWMTHPAALKGNSAVPLISRDGGMNDDFHGAMSPTGHLAACPYLQQVMASFGEVLGRSRLMKLAAGAEVAEHVDFNYHWYTRVRVHIPVITNPDVAFHCAGETLHMRAGECWIFNSWRRHRVINGSRFDRVHLVIDLAGSSRFWSTVREMQDLQPFADRELPAGRMTTIPYAEGRQVTLRTERFNVSPVMSPGELDALVREIVEDFAANEANDARLAARYRALLEDFTKDWREAWHLYGFRREGLPKYQAAIDAVRQQLHPDNRALTTRSNGVGVNPVIVQRILRAALVPDQLDRFRQPDSS